jgi:hypothetical protein
MDITKVAMAWRLNELELQCVPIAPTGTEQDLSKNGREGPTINKNLSEQHCA